MNVIFIILFIILIFCLFGYETFTDISLQNKTDDFNLVHFLDIPKNNKNELNKKIWILWLQGWEHAPWLSKRVGESWEINNPEWEVIYVSLENLKDYVNDIDYIYDENKNISQAAKSDIIRLSVLKNHGGVWADATMLCLQPLDPWIFDAVKPGSIWMYHGNGGYMSNEEGPASWFIIAIDNSYMITKWKESCDNYWNNNNEAHDYFWMDILFRELIESDDEFKQLWLKVPHIYCELRDQSNVTAHYRMNEDDDEFKELILNKPPYAIKLCNRMWKDYFPEPESDKYDNLNGYYAIKMSTRQFIYKHEMN